MTSETRTVGGHVRRTVENREKYRAKKTVQEGIRAVHEHLFRGEYADAAVVLDRTVVDPMGMTPPKLARAVRQIDETELGYEYLSTKHFLEHTRDYVEYFHAHGRETARDGARERARGFVPSIEVARERLRDAFMTLETIAIEFNLLRLELENSSPLEGYGTQIGVVYKDFERDLPETVEFWGVVNDDLEATAIQGRPGFGKSTAVETIAEDRYIASQTGAREFKVIDFLDWLECENVFYDIPNQDDELVDEREDLDLPKWYDEIDGVDEPDVEILMPLTPKLANRQIPYNTETDEYVVTPFTIPASEIDKRSLKAFLTHTTTVQDSTLERAFKRVRDLHDWSLADLADAIRRVGDDEGVIERLETTLETLQYSGFIRDKQCEHTIDWDRIMRSKDTISAFSVSSVDDRAEKLMIMLYITNSLTRERQARHDLPALSGAFREFHSIIPPEAKKTKDARERQLLGALIDEWYEFSVFHRHVDVELVCDSQHFETQIHSDIRANFGKGLTFRNKKPSVKKFWKAYGADYDESYIRRVANQFSPGDFAYLGDSNVDERTFHSPCYMAPPMSHHIDTKVEGHGLDSRVRYKDEEELRPAPWSAKIPPRLKVGRRRSRRSTPDKNDKPVAYFAHHCLESTDLGYWVETDAVFDAYERFARENELRSLPPSSIGTKLRAYFGDDKLEKKPKMVDGNQFQAYWGIRFVGDYQDLADVDNYLSASAD